MAAPTKSTSYVKDGSEIPGGRHKDGEREHKPRSIPNATPGE
jgi:hypothetical protein